MENFLRPINQNKKKGKKKQRKDETVSARAVGKKVLRKTVAQKSIIMNHSNLHIGCLFFFSL